MKIKVPNSLTLLAELIYSKCKKELFVVGGYVRGQLLCVREGEQDDIDLCSAVTPDELKAALNGSDFLVKDKNEKLGVMVICYQSEEFEHATFRKETYEVAGIHEPTAVEFVSTPEEDYIRRDFSVNAIYYDLYNEQITDPSGGAKDLENRIVRAVTLPRFVFQNDGIRIMRLIRVACSLGFEIEKETLRVAKENSVNLRLIKKSLIRNEFSRIIQADIEYPSLKDTSCGHARGITMIGEFGIWKYIIPRIEDFLDTVLYNKRTKKFVYEEIVNRVLWSHPDVRLSAFLFNIGAKRSLKENKESTLGYIPRIIGDEGLGYSPEIVKRVTRIMTMLYELLINKDYLFKNKRIRFVAKNQDIIKYIIMLLCAIKKESTDGKKDSFIAVLLSRANRFVKSYNAPLNESELAIKGIDIIKAVPEIKVNKIKKLMEYLWKFTVCHPVFNNKDYLLKKAQKYIQKHADIYLDNEISGKV